MAKLSELSRQTPCEIWFALIWPNTGHHSGFSSSRQFGDAVTCVLTMGRRMGILTSPAGGSPKRPQFGGGGLPLLGEIPGRRRGG